MVNDHLFYFFSYWKKKKKKKKKRLKYFDHFGLQIHIDKIVKCQISL